jgi:hypothetical protein
LNEAFISSKSTDVGSVGDGEYVVLIGNSDSPLFRKMKMDELPKKMDYLIVYESEDPVVSRADYSFLARQFALPGGPPPAWSRPSHQMPRMVS